MVNRHLWWWSLPFGLLILLSVGAPFYLTFLGVESDAISAYGTWFAAAIVAFAATVAIPQLAVTKAATDTEVFLKICAIIDEEERFGANYERVRTNSETLKSASVSADGTITVEKDGELANAANDVLYTLEQAGILFYYTANQKMVAEYVGDVVINAYEVLSGVIAESREKQGDKSMYERFEAMYRVCKKTWRGKTSGMPHTNA